MCTPHTHLLPVCDGLGTEEVALGAHDDAHCDARYSEQFPTPFCVTTAPFPRSNRLASFFSVCVSAATPPAAVHAYTLSVVPLLRVAASTVLTQ